MANWCKGNQVTSLDNEVTYMKNEFLFIITIGKNILIKSKNKISEQTFKKDL